MSTRRRLLIGLGSTFLFPHVARSLPAAPGRRTSPDLLTTPTTLQAWFLAVPGVNVSGTQWRNRLPKPHATLTNLAPTTTKGINATTRPGGYGEFRFVSASNTQASFANLPGLMNVNKVSYGAWFKRSTSGSNIQAIVANSGFADMMGMSLETDGNAYANIRGGQYGWTAAAGTGWFHVFAVFDGLQTGDALRLKLYINGAPKTLTFPSAGIIGVTTPNLTDPWYIGSNGQGTYNNGAVDDVQFYTGAMSDAQVRALYQDSRLGYPGWPGKDVWPAPAVVATSTKPSISGGTY